ncbi:MAG: DUF547 domain-containing protein [Robiginitomaculum sp.]
MSRLPLRLLSVALLSSAILIPLASATPISARATSTITASSAPLSQFTPRPGRQDATLDYAIYDELLSTIVIDTGPSLRRKARAPQRRVGTKIAFQHTSAYRLEGNKIPFSTLTKKHKRYLQTFKKAMVRTANKTDITSLSKDEQLAYWINLHNVVMLDTLADNYPVRRPYALKIKGVALNDAKLIKINGTPLSLRDIREKIVYANWSNPDVIYGFWQGDIGGVSLRSSAYTSNGITAELAQNASRYANSIRGFQRTDNNLLISTLYHDVQPIFFPNFKADLLAHLKPHMRDEVRGTIDSGLPLKLIVNETVIADLTAGYGEHRSVSPMYSAGKGSLPGRDTGSNISAMTRELTAKKVELRAQGLIGPGSEVIISDQN